MQDVADKFVGPSRLFIGVIVIVVYALLVLATAIYLIQWAQDKDDSKFKDLSELLKVGVLPIVTLVIGYYFGTKSSA